jgi:hypothetical protein
MSGAAPNLDQEFWSPPTRPMSRTASPAQLSSEVCPRCATEFVVGSRFCHVCGKEREAQPEINSTGPGRFLDISYLRGSLGLSVGALIAFVIGLVCVIIAALVSAMYTATTTLDWQAIQIWRIQWLLAAVVAFLGGLLLKRNS